MSNNRRHLANAVRALAMDAVQKANSGHPGAPMGMADIAEVLWNDYMKHNPTNPKWADRDRFILSNGHGSMLIYSLLHLAGYDLGIEDIKQFRQLHSRTPGHPEYGYAPGIETTTGPLGQGITNGVGMALAEKTLAAQFNKPGHTIVDHNTYVFLGDGCLMEGISHEACSLAGTLGLGKLVAFWDDNGISIDGEVEGWFTDDTAARFEAYGWQVIRDVDGHDADEIKQAIDTARAETGKPTMICCRTIIGFGSPNKAGTHDCHGAALGDEEIALVRKELNWDSAPFEIPADVYKGWDNKEAGQAAESDWDKTFAAYAAEYPTEAAEFTRRVNHELSADWDAAADAFIAEVAAKGEFIASRKASQNAIEALAKITPEFLGGSADLAGSNLTLWSGAKPVIDHADGNYVNYGVREFGMAAMINGISLHGGFVPYGATFLMFSEYARNALRMAALMKIGHIEVFTHDSIGLGEDGPTHQPVEQTATLRMIPNMDVWRPCDAVESAVAWKVAIKNNTGPTSLIFSRQNLPHQERTADQIKLIERGGYILKDCEGTPDVIIIGTGSELSLAMEAAAAITDKKVRVVSMPSTNAFDKQDDAYRESVLPASVSARVAVEAGVTGFWAKYVGLNGKVIGIDTFGESAPAGELFKMFGITTEAVIAAVNDVA
ncbi:MAG TPA: transketolase [Mariprofundaceae bacterium]|nr:transketolase [Mariprofundaceae bacterium]